MYWLPAIWRHIKEKLPKCLSFGMKCCPYGMCNRLVGHIAKFEIGLTLGGHGQMKGLGHGWHDMQETEGFSLFCSLSLWSPE